MTVSSGPPLLTSGSDWLRIIALRSLCLAGKILPHVPSCQASCAKGNFVASSLCAPRRDRPDRWPVEHGAPRAGRLRHECPPADHEAEPPRAAELRPGV